MLLLPLGGTLRTPLALRVARIQKSFLQKYLRIKFQQGSLLCQNVEIPHLPPVISMGCTLGVPPEDQGGPPGQSCFNENVLEFHFSWGPFYKKCSKSALYQNPIFGPPPGGPGVDPMKKGLL